MGFEIKTERLVLRPFSEEDAPALNKISNEPGILKWMPDWENDVAGTERVITTGCIIRPKPPRATPQMLDKPALSVLLSSSQ